MTTSDSELQGLIGQWRERMAASPDAWTDVDLTFTQLRALFVLGRQPLRVSDLASVLGVYTLVLGGIAFWLFERRDVQGATGGG